MRFNFFPLFIALLGLAVISGCRPYAVPLIQEAQEFPGARDFAKDTKRVKLVLTHGMCSGDHLWHDLYGPEYNWVATRATQIAEAVGDEGFERRTAYPLASVHPLGAIDGGEVQRFDLDITGSDGTVYEVAFFTWGRSVKAARQALRYENTKPDDDPDAPARATFNRTLKTELMNKCLIDVVVYNGTAGDVIRSAMREAVCTYLGGKIVGPNSGSSGSSVRCTGLRPVAERANGKSIATVLVPESLGTRVLIDAVRALDDGRGGAARATAFGPIRAIHLASNQLPLLKLADAPLNKEQSLRASAQDALGGFISEVAQPSLDRADFPGDKANQWSGVSVVAYTDPNDPFGYRISKADFPDSQVARLTNVVVSNTPVWFGFIADPLKAHSGTARPQVFEMILDGSDPND